MDIPPKYLLEWAKKYVRHKDMHTKAIRSVEEKGSALLVAEHQGKKMVYCMPLLSVYQPSAEYAGHLLVSYNTRKNIEALFKGWDFFSKQKDLTIIFLNPMHHDSKWVLKPYIHNRITEPSALKKGLLAMMQEGIEMDESDYAALRLEG